MRGFNTVSTIVTGSAKTDHLYKKLLFEILGPFCSAVLALHCRAIGFSITHSVPKLCISEHKHTRLQFAEMRVQSFHAVIAVNLNTISSTRKVAICRNVRSIILHGDCFTLPGFVVS